MKIFPRHIFCLCLLFFVTFPAKAEVERMILKESDDGRIIIEQIGSSLFVRFFSITNWGSDKTRRYMDITSIMSVADFVNISEKIRSAGREVSFMMQKPHIESWDYCDISFTRELSPHWDPHPRYEIEIDEYTFVYYPGGGHGLDVARYGLSIWNFHVPNYQEGHVYVMVIYSDVTDSTTDAELLEQSRTRIEKLMKLQNAVF